MGEAKRKRDRGEQQLEDLQRLKEERARRNAVRGRRGYQPRQVVLVTNDERAKRVVFEVHADGTVYGPRGRILDPETLQLVAERHRELYGRPAPQRQGSAETSGTS